MRVSRSIILFFLALALAAPAFPQGSTATVSGTVRDLTGAVIPACEIQLTNTATNAVSRSLSNQAGYFVFPAISPGNYRVRVEHTGMQVWEAAATVQVQQSVVVNPVLQPGQTSTTVEVRDVTPMVTTDNPAIGHVLERQRIEQLPINGRSVYTLFQTVPGMEDYRAYGLREGSMEITLDGAAIIDKSRGRGTYRAPGLDSIQEFKAEVNSSSARYTRPTTVVLSTRSGTNTLHGSIFETHRNNAIGRARTRQDVSSKAPQLIRNEFGVSAGAPVMLPKIYDGRNRTFFFFAYEAHRQVSPSTSSYRIPTEAMRNGDFRGLVDSQGRLSRLFDPWTTNLTNWSRQPFAYGGNANVIDPKLQSPVSKYLNSIIPLPTHPEVNPLVAANWYGPIDNRSNQYTTSTRIDHRFSDRDAFYARYTHAGYYDFSVNGVPTADGGANNTVTSSPNRSLALSYVRTFSPTLFNELLLTGSREDWYIGQKERDTDFARMLGLPNPFNSFIFPQFPTTGFSGFSYQPINPRGSANFYYMIDDNVTKVSGRHQFEFGGHFRKDMLNMLPDQQQNAGSVVPLTNYTALYDPATSRVSPSPTSFTGQAAAALFLGTVSDKAVLNRGMFYGRSKEYALYFQDDFNVSPRLTLRMGLRWEYWPAYREKNDFMLGFSQEKRAVVSAAPLEKLYALGATFPSVVNRLLGFGGKIMTYKEAGLPQTLRYDNYKNFGPRFGIAYRALEGRREFILRGGFRTSYFVIPLRTWAGWVKSAVPARGDFAWNPDDATQSPDGGYGWSLRSAPTVIAGVNSQNIIDMNNANLLARGASFGLGFFRPRNMDPRTHDWNVTFEKEIMANTVVKASYIGNHSDGLEQWNSPNDAMPAYLWYLTTGTPLPAGEFSDVARRGWDNQVYGNLKIYEATGWGNFHGAQFELERRYSKGVAFQLFYVMSNALHAGGEGTDVLNYATYMFAPGTVPADYDTRNKLMNYRRDDAIPKHRLRFNWMVDLPFGKGTGGLLKKIVGGWQLAGMGHLRSTYFSLPTDMYPNGNKIESYGYKYPIEDCRSNVCYPGYLWWNGYIPAHRINSYDLKTGKPNGVMGVPADYKPAVQPLIPWPANPDSKDPLYAYFGTNTVWVPMKDGSTQRIAYYDGYPVLNNQFMPSVRQWNLDSSLVKNFPFAEGRCNVRFSADFFNVLNHPGNPSGAGSDGVLSTRNSGTSARQTQLSLRVSW